VGATPLRPALAAQPLTTVEHDRGSLLEADRSILKTAQTSQPGTGLVRSTTWMTMTAIVTRGLAFARTLALAQTLAPADFGLFGIAITVMGVATIAGDLGAAAYLVYRPVRDRREVDTAFWMNTALATASGGLLLATAPLLAIVYKRPELIPVMGAVAAAAAFQIAGNFPRSILRVQSKFRAMGIIEILSASVGLLLGLALAAWGFGVWSLVLTVLLSNLVTLIGMQLIGGWRPRLQVSRRALRLVTSFSAWYTASTLGWYAAMSIDNLLLGRLLGTAALGVYVMAFNIATVPFMLLSGPLAQVFFPRLARLKETPASLWKVFEDGSQFQATVSMPLCAALAVAASDYVPALLGHRWLGIVGPLQVLLACVAIRLWMLDPLAALGRFQVSLPIWLAASSVEALGILLLATRFGILGASVVVLVSVGTAYVVSLPVAARSFRQLGLRLTNSLPLFVATSVGVVVGLIEQTLVRRGVPSLVSTIPAAALTGLIVLLPPVIALRRYLMTIWAEMWNPGDTMLQSQQ
jgi:lipopolysaccharide exporter